MRRAPGAGDRGGFALALVVFMLFAIAVAGATGYQVVSSEFSMAQQNRDGQEALAVARAGLYRFVAEQLGPVGDSVSYAIGDGIASVTAQKVLQVDTLNDLYFIKSVGQVADARTPLLPAERTVGTYAYHRKNPITPKAAYVSTGGQLRIYGNGAPYYYSYWGRVDGADNATPSDCTFGGTVPRYGIATAGSVVTYGGSYAGTPTGMVNLGSFNAVYDTVGIRWDILSDPSFPLEFDNDWPDFADLDADSFPIVRVKGDFTAWGSTYSGRGVLIVTGRLVIVNSFVWDGIILAGQFYYTSGNSYNIPRINGMLVGGLSSPMSAQYIIYGDLRYHSCNAYKANRALSYLELVDGGLFEVNN